MEKINEHRANSSIKNIAELHKNKEPWLTTLLAGIVPIIKERETAELAINTYRLFRYIDNYIEKSEENIETKLKIIDRANTLLLHHNVIREGNNIEFNKETIELFDRIGGISLLTNIIKSPVFDDESRDLMLWGLNFMRIELETYGKDKTPPTQAISNYLAVGGVLPYTLLATKFLFGKPLAINPEIIRLSIAMQKGDNVRDLEEDLKHGQKRFSSSDAGVPDYCKASDISTKDKARIAASCIYNASIATIRAKWSEKFLYMGGLSKTITDAIATGLNIYTELLQQSEDSRTTSQ